MMSKAPNSLEIDYKAISSSKNNNFRCPETDLTLSLPGSQDHPHQQTQPNANSSAYPHNSTRNFAVAVADADASSAGKWGLSVYSASPCQLALFSPGAGAGAGTGKVVNVKDMDIDVASDSLKTPLKKNPTANARAPKTQVVGWPPIRSFRKNSLASSRTKNSNEADEKSGLTCLYVKVRMDGAPYLRKVDLRLYKNYKELSLALKKMFSSFPVGGSESHLNDQSQGSERVLTYEDKDGDWMLVGDVPWDMFTSTCKRLRIMKGTEAIGLAPRRLDNEDC